MPGNQKEYPKLQASLQTEVAIIGGGITGLLCAYVLSEAGKRVVVLEKNTIGSGATKYTTAFLTQIIDTRYADLTGMIGKKQTGMVAKSHQEAINMIEQIIKKEGIDCNFMRCSSFMYANLPPEVDELSKETEAIKKSGIEATFNISKGNLGFINFGYSEVKNQAKFNANKFVAGLAQVLQKKGVMIFEQSKAAGLKNNKDIIDIKSGRHIIKADTAIVATYEPFNKPLALYFKKGFYTSYVISAAIPKGIIKEALYQDTLNPYHYFRIDSGQDNDTITIGGEDHRSALKFNKKKIFGNLEKYLKTILPGVNYNITATWSGPILEPVDGLPSIGRLGKSNILYAMAFSGNGMTYSAISAEILTGLIMGTKNGWLKIYSADRIPKLKSLAVKAKDYTQELIYDIEKNFFS